MYRFQFRGTASDQNIQRKLIQQHDVDIQRLWKRLNQTPQDYVGLMGDGSGGAGSPAQGGAIYLAQCSSLTLNGNSATFTIFSGTPGSETSTGKTITAYIRDGLVYANKMYKVGTVGVASGTTNAPYEVIDPSLQVRGQFAADLAPDSAATFTVFIGANGSEATTGVSISSVWNPSSCSVKGSKMAEAHWVKDNGSWHVHMGKTI